MIAYITHSEPGGHAENEDRVEVMPLSGTSSAYLCVMADGQGGQAGGALAATIACRTCLETASAYQLDQLLYPLSWPAIARRGDEAVANAEDAGFTTLIAFCLTETALCGVSSGDSAVLLQNAGENPLLLTQQQRKNPPVGSGAAVFMPFAAQLVSPWSVLAMTDGVWKYAGWPTILAVAGKESVANILSQIRAKAGLLRTGFLQDDFTLAVFQG